MMHKNVHCHVYVLCRTLGMQKPTHDRESWRDWAQMLAHWYHEILTPSCFPAVARSEPQNVGPQARLWNMPGCLASSQLSTWFRAFKAARGEEVSALRYKGGLAPPLKRRKAVPKSPSAFAQSFASGPCLSNLMCKRVLSTWDSPPPQKNGMYSFKHSKEIRMLHCCTGPFD